MNHTAEAVLRFIVDYLDEHFYPPTLREIAEGVDKVLSVVAHHVNALEAADLIGRGPKGASRAIWVTEAGRKAVKRQVADRAQPAKAGG